MTEHTENEYSSRETDALPHETQDHDLGDTTVVLGRVLPFPLYTVVFFALGIMTIIEVLLGSLDGGLRIPILLGMAAVKAYLVVYFYMHLKSDSRFFALALGIPVFVALVSMLFMLMTPHGNY